MNINLNADALAEIDKALTKLLNETVEKLKDGYSSKALCRFAVADEIQKHTNEWHRNVVSGMRFDFRGNPTVTDKE